MTVAPVKRPTPTFRYGAAFFDDRTGIRFEAHHPQERPDLWIRYLDGLHKRFAKHGFGEIVDRDQLLDGSGVSMFFVGLDQNDDVVAGIRIHGPLDSVDQASTLQEMSRSPEIDRLRRIVARYIPYGVIEGKGAWGRKKGAGLHSVMQTLMRCWHQALAWTESEVLLGVVNERNRAIIAATGARELSTQSVPFPTDELRAILMWGRRPRTAKLCDPDQARRSRIEADQLRSQLDSSTSGWSSPAAPASNSWRCIVLDERTRAQRQIIRTLSSDPQTVVIDRLADQRAELERLVPRIGHEIQGETPRYVYFPWRSTLVKMLGPTGFERLRLDRNRNKVTLEEQARFRSLRIGIVGLSVGHVIAHTLALRGCAESCVSPIWTGSSSPTSTASPTECSTSGSTRPWLPRAASQRSTPISRFGCTRQESIAPTSRTSSTASISSWRNAIPSTSSSWCERQRRSAGSRSSWRPAIGASSTWSATTLSPSTNPSTACSAR